MASFGHSWNRPAVLAALFGLLWTFAVDATARERPPAEVAFALAAIRPLAPSEWVPGTVVGRHRARVAAEEAGRLLEVADVGQHLTPRTPAFRIDDSALRRERAIARAAVEREQARIRYLDREAERLRSLARTNNAAQTQLEKTVSELDVARADLEAARARALRIDERLRRLAPPPPYSATVLERLKEPGEWAAVGDPILSIADENDVEIEATADVSRLPFVQAGRSLAIERRGSSGYVPAGQATVRTIVGAADTGSHRFLFRLDPGPGSAWRIGEAVRVAIPLSDGRAVLSVPRDALVLRPQGVAVFRIDDGGRAERVPVQTGIAAGPYIEIRGGIDAGDRVIVRGAERLRPGQPVHASPYSDAR